MGKFSKKNPGASDWKFYRDSAGQWKWRRLIKGNWIHSTDGYNSRAACIAAARRLGYRG